MSFTNPTVGDFKTWFARDFVFGTNADEEVLDADIDKALKEAATKINPNLFCSEEAYDIAFLNLAAHILVLNLKTASNGCSDSEPWLISSKGAGAVSTSFAIPQAILDNPLYAWYTKTAYGNNYLMTIYPLLAGQVILSKGGTTV